MRLNYVERRGVHSAVPGHTLKADKAVHSTARSHDSVSCALGLSARHVRNTSGARRAPRKTPPPPPLVRPPRGHAAPTAHRPDAEGLERSGRGRTGAGVWVVASSAVRRTRLTRGSSESRRYAHLRDFARLDVSPSSAEKEPERTTFIRRTDPRRGVSYTRRFYSRQGDSMDIRYRALWISRVDGASSMPDGAHWLAQSRSPQTPSRRAGCGSLMWAALSMSICVIILGGVLRLAEAAAAAVA
jgi:hypothetical protein